MCDAGRVSGGPPPTSPAAGWQVRPDATALKPGETGHAGRADLASAGCQCHSGDAGHCPPWWLPRVHGVRGFSRMRRNAASGPAPGRLSHGQSAAGDSSGSDGTQGGHISAEPRINERIRVPEVRLVGPAGEQVGIVSIDDALRLAQEADLDLVEVAPTARPPVCKLMDYGKFKYESALKARESRKNQTQTVIKEIKLRPKIDPHDYGTKKGHVERFLKAGDKVKVTIMFRGREQSRPELGFRLLQRLAGDVDELGFVEAQPKQDGRNMTMVIGPHRRKSDAKADRPVHQQAERSHPERPERSPQTERGPRTQPVQAQPAEAQPVQAQPADAQPVQAQPVRRPAGPGPARRGPAGPGPARPAPSRSRPSPSRPSPPTPSRSRPSRRRRNLLRRSPHRPSPRLPGLRLPGPRRPGRRRRLRTVRPPGRFPARAPCTPPRRPRPGVPRTASRRPSSQARKSRPTDRTPAQRLTQRVPGAGAVWPGTGTGTNNVPRNPRGTHR